MNLLKRLLRPAPAPAAAVKVAEDEGLPLDGVNPALLLLDKAEQGDVGHVLAVLDRHMETLGQQGQDVREWTRWVEDRLGQSTEPLQASHLAVLGSIYQRLEGSGRVANCQKALGYYQRAIEAYRRADNSAGVAVLLNNTGLLYCELAEVDRAQYRCAIPLFEEALAYYEERDELSYRGAICLSLGEAYAQLDEAGADHFELARDFYERAWALFERSGERSAEAAAQGGLGDMQVELASFCGGESLVKAVRHFRNALSIYVDFKDVAAQAHYQERLGRTYAMWREDEHLRKALRAYERASADYILCGQSQRAAQVGIELARLGIALQEWETAFKAASQALQLFSELGVDGGRAQCFHLLAGVYLSAGAESQREDVERAEHCLLEAQRLFLHLQWSEEYGKIASELQQVQNLIRGVAN